MTMSDDGATVIGRIAPKPHRIREDERGLDPQRVAAAMDEVEEALQNVAFVAVTLGRWAHWVVFGDAPRDIREAFVLRCQRQRSNALKQIRRLEKLRIGEPDMAA